MEEQLARLGSSEAKAEAIQTRQVEVLESQRYVDPIRYMTFMERIKKTLSDYMQERDSEKYLSSMEKWQKTIELAGVQLNIQRILWMIAMQSLSMVLFVQVLKSQLVLLT